MNMSSNPAKTNYIPIIGIIGGGQLAFLLCLAAKKINCQIIILDPNKACSASHACYDIIVGDYGDETKLSQLFQRCDIITYEFENVDVKLIAKLNQKYPKCLQTYQPLFITQDRLREKLFALQIGIPTPTFYQLNEIDDVTFLAPLAKLPCLVKTRFSGYDGKGQAVISNVNELKTVSITNLITNHLCLLESKIDFIYEFSVIFGVSQNSKIILIGYFQNYHETGILRFSKIFTPSKKLQKIITGYMQTFAKKMNCCGIFTLEFFLSGDKKIIFNEFAPRVHNSGHLTTYSCSIDQFQAHLLLLLNQPFSSHYLSERYVMINVLGQHYQNIIEMLKTEQALTNKQLFWIDYNKSPALTNRKMGHLCIHENNIQLIKTYLKAVSLKENLVT